ncbi:hypothetical protein GWI34_34735 [Actinomadura sp. DSM 109109]|nr:hypothetical protein [Actinomadura lepetitiana]
MNEIVQQAARGAAERLAPEYGERLRADVEAALHSGDGVTRHERYDPVAIGGLIVSVATLAWTIYQDHRKKHDERPPVQVVIRTVRIELGDGGVPRQVDAEQRDRIIQAVVEETVRGLDDEPER